MSGSSWRSYVIPPVFLASMVYAKGIFGDKQAPESPVLLLDVVANVIGYESAKLISEQVIDKLMANNIMQEGSDRVVEPAIQGLVNALIPHFSVDKAILQSVANVSPQRQLRVQPLLQKSFGDRFTDGVLFNVAATYLSEPLV